MNAQEVRMRCIEALSGMGIREPGRILADAAKLEEWVNAAVIAAPVADKGKRPPA